MSSIVIGSAVFIVSEIGRLFSSDTPRLPWKSPETQRQYCDGYEPSRPSWCAAAALASGVAVASPPNMMSMMLPGSSRTAEKITIETATRVAIIERKRWATNRYIR